MNRQFPLSYYDALNKLLVVNLDTERDALSVSPIQGVSRAPV